MTSTLETPPRQPRTRLQFWTLVAVFFAPLALAFLLYSGLDGWRPPGQTNKGELIEPPRPLPAVALTSSDGATLDADLLRGKWTLVYVGGGTCDARCREALVLTRQTRLALNDDMKRVQRMFIATGECCDRAWLDAEQPGLIVALGDTAPAREVLAEFPVYDGVPVAQAGRIYIVDPLGNLMMSYAPDAPDKGLLEDLKKLLKLSHIG